MGIDKYLKGLYDKFDKDSSDEIDLKEFIAMLKFIQLPLEDRIGIMLFRLFDRRSIGIFSYEEFSDIVDRKMKPNYKKLVWLER